MDAGFAAATIVSSKRNAETIRLFASTNIGSSVGRRSK